jgi:hypothetical protein
MSAMEWHLQICLMSEDLIISPNLQVIDSGSISLPAMEYSDE